MVAKLTVDSFSRICFHTTETKIKFFRNQGKQKTERNSMNSSQNKKAAIVTLGCRVNQYESRAIGEYLEKAGVTVSEEPQSDCGVVIVNTCAVTAESERKSRQTVRRINKLCPDAKIIVTGCHAQLHPENAKALPGVSYICGNEKKLDCVREALSLLENKAPTEKTGNLVFSGQYENYAVSTPDHTRAYIKIEDGCENKCTYCIIPKVRGPVRSKPASDVISEVKDVCSKGYREIVLTGIETCSYGYGLAELIEKLSEIPTLERIRLSSVNPAKINRNFTDRVAGNSKFCPHFHLSLQSFCDRTLNRMKRQYNTKMICENCLYIREKIKNVCFTADMICGFPGETDSDFEQTLKNTAEFGLLYAHIFPYSDRPGTEASAMSDKISKETAEARCAELRKTVGKTRNIILNKFISDKTPLKLLVEKCANGMITGHTENFIETKAAVTSMINPGQTVNIFIKSHDDSLPFNMPESVVF